MPRPLLDTADDAQIRYLIGSLAEAVRAKDPAAVASHYTPDAEVFDIAPPLRTAGMSEAALGDWFATFEGPVGLDVRDLIVTVNDHVAFCHSLHHLSGARTDGSETDVWMRVTVCLRNLDGGWAIAHEHTSVPTYMDGSARQAVDLQP